MIEDDEDDEDIDSVVDDCGESTILCADDARSQVRHYNIVLASRFSFMKDTPSRFNKRSILFGL